MNTQLTFQTLQHMTPQSKHSSDTMFATNVLVVVSTVDNINYSEKCDLRRQNSTTRSILTL